MKRLLNNGIDKVAGRKNYEAICSLYDEKDALNLANGITNIKKKTKKPQL